MFIDGRGYSKSVLYHNCATQIIIDREREKNTDENKTKAFNWCIWYLHDFDAFEFVLFSKIIKSTEANRIAKTKLKRERVRERERENEQQINKLKIKSMWTVNKNKYNWILCLRPFH